MAFSKKALKKTQADKESLEKVLQVISSEPRDFTLHPKIKKILEKKKTGHHKQPVGLGFV